VNEFESAQVMTLRDYASIIWRRKWFIILPVMSATLVAGFLTTQQTSMYRSSAEVLVRLPPTASSVGSTGAVMSPRLIENELEAAQGSGVRTIVQEMVGPEPTLTVISSEASDVFVFTAISTNADLAARAANTYAEQYIERQKANLIAEYDARSGVISEQLEAIERGDGDANRRSEYSRELDDLNVSIDLARTSGAVVIDEAVPPGGPFEPSPQRNVSLAITVGLLLGLAAAFLAEYLDTSLKDEEDLVRRSGFPNLAVIPRIPGTKETDGPQVVSLTDPRSPAAEAFRGLRTSVQFISIDKPIRILQVTSPLPGDGKTTAATNLAVIAARAGQRVVLIDCDLRKPQVHNCFELDNEFGFTSVVLGELTLHKVAQKAPGIPTLLVVTSGPLPPNPSELLQSERAHSVFASVGESTDLLILDCPPVLPVADSLALTSAVDGVIVVASAGSTDVRQMSKTMARLRQVNAPILGTVLNRLDPDSSSDYAYGSYVANDEDSAEAQGPSFDPESLASPL
jgi:succinoglycan biosynthesis transport protein ExoP